MKLLDFRPVGQFMHSVAEQVGDITRSVLPWEWLSYSGIRGIWNGNHRFTLRFWPTKHPAAEGTVVNYDVLRSLYRNDGDYALGSGFAKPIIDLETAFIGTPRASSENEALTENLNKCLNIYWVDEIQQMLRDSMRDSMTVVRISRPDILDPLMTMEEASHCALETIPAERVDIQRNPRNKRIIDKAVVHHKMKFVRSEGSVEGGVDPVVETHDVLEIITRQRYTFYDLTESRWLDNLAAPNPWNMVPLLEVFNEWDSSLQGGQSDLETVIPFIKAFHDVLTQGLQAHGYHSTPKVVLKLQDIIPFIKNNLPEAYDETTGSVKPRTEVNWRGRELLILQTDENVEFLEANSILGDTKILLEFLIDCICIASQTPEWAFMRVDSGSANSDRNAQTVPFVKKIERKRKMFTKSIQELLKMYMVTMNLIPVRVEISWEIVRPDDQMIMNQAFQQLVMGLEVAKQSGQISDETYMTMIRQFLPAMKSNSIEAQDALNNVQTAIPIAAGPQGENE